MTGNYYDCPDRDTVSEAQLPPGCWISRTRRPCPTEEYGTPRPWGWLGKIQCEKLIAPSSKSLWAFSPVELVCRLPAMWLEMHGDGFVEGTSD